MGRESEVQRDMSRVVGRTWGSLGAHRTLAVLLRRPEVPTLAVLLRPRSEDLFAKTADIPRYLGRDIPGHLTLGYPRISTLAVLRAGRPTLADLLPTVSVFDVGESVRRRSHFSSFDLLPKCRTLAQVSPGGVLWGHFLT